MANCKICGKNITLSPSAEERAKKYGGKPADYTKLFESHTECVIKKRGDEAQALLQKLARPRAEFITIL